MKTKTEVNIDILTKAGVVLKGDESALQIYQMVQKLGKDSSLADTKTQATTGNFIVWLKSRAYVDDKVRLECGVFILNEIPARFSKLTSATVEVFENEVPSKKVAQIARWAGINPDGVEDEEILSKVIVEPKYIGR